MVRARGPPKICAHSHATAGAASSVTASLRRAGGSARHSKPSTTPMSTPAPPPSASSSSTRRNTSAGPSKYMGAAATSHIASNSPHSRPAAPPSRIAATGATKLARLQRAARRRAGCTVRTGQQALRLTLSATEPSNACRNDEWPCVPITTRSAPTSSAARQISTAAAPIECRTSTATPLADSSAASRSSSATTLRFEVGHDQRRQEEHVVGIQVGRDLVRVK